MLSQIGIYEIEPPSKVHECGPQWSNLIDDDLSKAKGYYLMGYNIIWIYREYRTKLQSMIDNKTWRSGDAALFALALDRAYADAIAVSQTEAVRPNTPLKGEAIQV